MSPARLMKTPRSSPTAVTLRATGAAAPMPFWVLSPADSAGASCRQRLFVSVPSGLTTQASEPFTLFAC